MIRLKSREEIEILKEGGKRLASILEKAAEAAKDGVSAEELNTLACRLAEENGDKPAFLDYQPSGASRPYPAGLCVSVNDEIVHGIPNEKEKILKEGDIVSLDMGLVHQGLITDSAVTIGVGKIDSAAKKLIAATKEALKAGIAAAILGGHIGDIGAAVFFVAKRNNFSVVLELAGHGVGYAVHEDPYVPNFGKQGEGPELQDGMVIAIEPMLNEGVKDVVLDNDGYTYRTKDGKRSAHFEHTIAITAKGTILLTGGNKYMG